MKRMLLALAAFSGFVVSNLVFAQSWCDSQDLSCQRRNDVQRQDEQIIRNNENPDDYASSQPRIVYLPPKPTQYGAVALNERTGAYGFSSNQATEKRSKQEAVNDCGENGCKIIAHYSNQCVAFAWGAVGNSGYSSVKVGLNKTTAEENALVSCHTGAANCSIIYSGCSLP